MNNLINLLTQKTALKREHIENILKLLEEGSTIPFIARYRKEMTGGADDEVLREFETIYMSAKKLLERKEEILRLIAERATLSDALKKSIEDAESLRVLEDIYRPYKEKKNSRAATAIENGLSPLSDILEKARLSEAEFKTKAKEFVKSAVTSVDEAVQGAQDILAERYADMPRERESIRNNMLRHGVLEIKK
ncbi:MAG: Tex-like N-terminal domain-containing protein, partial [Sulfurimonas sp.]|uniref:Tex-like N-terminal domain-containing protein n=1 Tax=Sulfurimonas sp. TaxID=2022749 RepID=UPI0028CBE943